MSEDTQVHLIAVDLAIARWQQQLSWLLDEGFDAQHSRSAAFVIDLISILNLLCTSDTRIKSFHESITHENIHAQIQTRAYGANTEGVES